MIAACAITGTTVVGAWAAGEGEIDHAEAKAGTLRVLYSVPDLAEGVEPDLETLQISVNGADLEAEAELAASASAGDQVRRTTIMAIDTSNSMKGDRFEQAKAAAKSFLDAAPADVYVGIVAFAGSVEVVQEPTLDRDAAASVLDELSLSLETRLYDGVIAATKAAGSEGQRSLLVLSDGRDTSETDLEDAVDAVAASEVRVDVVALEEAAEANGPLEAMASEGGGTVIAAQDPDALTALFNDQAAALARQVLVTASLPEDFNATEGSVAVSVDAGGETYSDTAFVSFGRPRRRPRRSSPGPQPVEPPSLLMTPRGPLGGLAALGLGALVVLLGAFGVFGEGARSPSRSRSRPTRGRAPRRAQGRGSRSQASASGLVQRRSPSRQSTWHRRRWRATPGSRPSSAQSSRAQTSR